MLNCNNQEIRSIHPNASYRECSSVSSSLEGCMIIIDWLLIIVTDKGFIKVELMGIDYPYEPDVYEFDNLSVAVRFVKAKVKQLGLS